jgi:hypothetical protein
LELFKVGFKLIVTLGYMFDKAGTSTGYINLLCGAICSIILFQTMTRGIMF